MRDLVWTLILIWAAYRIFSLFRVGPASPKGGWSPGKPSGPPPETPLRDEAQKKAALKKHLNSAGEYVDFEEIR